MLETFGCRLRKLREGKNMTVNELADAVGLSRQHLHALERGDRDPSWSALCKLAEALDVEPLTFRASQD